MIWVKSVNSIQINDQISVQEQQTTTKHKAYGSFLGYTIHVLISLQFIDMFKYDLMDITFVVL